MRHTASSIRSVSGLKQPARKVETSSGLQTATNWFLRQCKHYLQALVHVRPTNLEFIGCAQCKHTLALTHRYNVLVRQRYQRALSISTVAKKVLESLGNFSLCARL